MSETTTNTTTPPATAARRSRGKALKSLEEAVPVAMEIAEIDNRLEALEVSKDREVNILLEDYANSTEPLAKQRQALYARLKVWATKNKSKAFDDKGRLEIGGHLLEFKVTPGKVATAEGITQDFAAQLIDADEDEDFASAYATPKVALDKTAILKQWRAGASEAWHKLYGLGIRIKQTEEFVFKAAATATKSAHKKGESK